MADKTFTIHNTGRNMRVIAGVQIPPGKLEGVTPKQLEAFQRQSIFAELTRKRVLLVSDSKEPDTEEPTELEQLPSSQAIARVSQSEDIDELKAFAKRERRPPVAKAISKRILALTSITPPAKKADGSEPPTSNPNEE